MEIKKTVPGYPCCQYEVKKITTKEELWYYAKSYVTTAIMQKENPQSVLQMLITTLAGLDSSTGVTCPDFNQYGKTSEDICSYIINNKDVPQYKSCTSLYRRIDSKTTSCRICPLSETLYRNTNVSIENAILKYMLSSEDNLNYVSKYVTGDFFQSCIDVSMGIPVNKAFIIPMARILVNSLLKNNIRLLLFSHIDNGFIDNSEPFDVVWEDAYATFPRARKITSVLTNNPMWEMALKSHVKAMIFNANDITKEQLQEVFKKYAEDGISDVPDDKSATYTEPSLEDVAVLIDESITDSKTAVIQSEQVLENKEINCSENDSLSGDNRTLTTTELKEEKIDPDLEIVNYNTYEEKNIIKTYTVSETLLRKCLFLTSEEQIPDAFYHGTLRDKQLSVEVIKDTQNNYLYLFYSRHMNRFLYCMADKIPEKVDELLSRNMIKKICHTPYLMYGITKLNNKVVKNIFSIQTAHNCSIPGQNTMDYKLLLQKYPTLKTFGSVISEDMSEECLFFCGMPLYRSIEKILSTMLSQLSEPDMYLKYLYLDEAIGYSYFYSVNFKDTGVNTLLMPDGKFIFKEQFCHDPINPGKFVSYYVTEKFIGLPLFVYIINGLVEKGLFRTSNVQLLGLHKQFMNMYIGKECEDYVTSLIDLIIFEYGRHYKQEGMLVNCTKRSS